MSAIRVTHLDHCTVLVTDVEKARAFYGGVLGLTEVPPPKEFDFVAVWYDLGGQYLHLLKKPQPDTPSQRHLCLHVTDIAEARRAVAEQGIPFDETTKIAAADRFFVRDPDGNRIELLQWLRPYRPDTDGRFSG